MKNLVVAHTLNILFLSTRRIILYVYICCINSTYIHICYVLGIGWVWIKIFYRMVGNYIDVWRNGRKYLRPAREGYHQPIIVTYLKQLSKANKWERFTICESTCSTTWQICDFVWWVMSSRKPTSQCHLCHTKWGLCSMLCCCISQVLIITSKILHLTLNYRYIAIDSGQ